MSRFFRASSSESSTTDDENETQNVPQTRVSKPVATYMFSDSEEETKRVVRTAKDKHTDSLRDFIKQMNNAKNIKDINKVLELFEEMSQTYRKAEQALKKADPDANTPRFYIKYLSELDTFIEINWENKKSFNKVNAKALPALRQKLRKYLKDFEKEVVDYRQALEAGDINSDDDEDEVVEEPELDDQSTDGDDSEQEEVKVTKTKTPKVAKADADSDDSEWESSSAASSDSELSDLEGKKMEDLRKYFLKAEFRGDSKGKTKDKKDKKKGGAREGKIKKDKYDEEGGWSTVQRGAAIERPKMFEKDTEISHELVLKKLTEILTSRGKKKTNREELVELLNELLKIAESNQLSAAIQVKIQFNVLAGMFEYNSKMGDCMTYQLWTDCLATSNELLELLEANRAIECSGNLAEEHENVVDSEQPYCVVGSVLAVVDRLDMEFTKMLQNADCHSTDYVDKLKGEVSLEQLIARVQKYMQEQEFDENEVCEIYMHAIEHLYYKFDERAVEECGSPAARMETLCQYVYTHDKSKRLRTRAILCHMYHHALHDRWHQARDLMLMSHLQATVDHSDAGTQILYNRAICQLGLCAFRHGFIREAHQGLSEIQNTMRAKELLAQGMMQRGAERTPEQEKLLKQRQVPYHMHINVELIECVYLICSMLLEIPQIVSREYELRRRMLSRSFHYQLKQSERQLLLGPPETTREHVVAAARALLQGDWKSTKQYIINEKMNTKVWNLFRRHEQVKSMVVRRIQEEALRTYLLMYTTVYSTLSMTFLAGMFELDAQCIHALISKMIISEELLASVDEPSDCVVMHRSEPSRLQYVALQFTEKQQQLADMNDQLLEPKMNQGYVRGGGHNAGNRGGHHNDNQGGWQNREGGRGRGGGGGYRGRGGRGGQNTHNNQRHVRFSRD